MIVWLCERSPKTCIVRQHVSGVNILRAERLSIINRLSQRYSLRLVSFGGGLEKSERKSVEGGKQGAYRNLVSKLEFQILQALYMLHHDDVLSTAGILLQLDSFQHGPSLPAGDLSRT